jgi:hypothetical protein
VDAGVQGAEPLTWNAVCTALAVAALRCRLSTAKQGTSAIRGRGRTEAADELEAAPMRFLVDVAIGPCGCAAVRVDDAWSVVDRQMPNFGSPCGRCRVWRCCRAMGT